MNINILFAFECSKNPKYLYYACTTMAQMLEKTSSKNFYNIHLIISANLMKFDFNQSIYKYYKNNNYKIIRYNADDFTEDLKNFTTTRPQASKGTWYRLLTFKILPKNIDKIISLDNDIFFNCDIADIYNIPMENNLAIGQIDWGYMNAITVMSNNDKSWVDKITKIFPKYINMGVCLYNLTKIPSDFYDCLLIESRKNWSIMEQDVINVLLNGKIKYLPAEYGINNTQRDYKNYYKYLPLFDENKILIEHMAFKPWQSKKINNFLLSNNKKSNVNRKKWRKIYKIITDNNKF